MAKPNSLVCVDSCAFISYLDGGQHRTADELAMLGGFFASVTEQNSPIHIIFPTFERAEILQCEMPNGAMAEFDRILDRPNIDEVPVNQEISTIAAEIRNYHTAARKVDRGLFELTTPDAILLATAIYYECPSLYTYDGTRPPPKKPRKLLGMKTPIAGKYTLKIKIPLSAQLGIV